MSDRSGGSGDEVGATSVLHPQPLAAPSDPAGLPPGGVVLSASSTTASSSGGGPVPGAKQKRPKRKQVKRACSNCRKSHSGCDDLRPCSRCIDNGLESSCADVPRKKRATRRKLPGDPSDFPGGDASAMADMLCPDGRGRVGKVAMARGGASNNNVIANSSSSSSSAVANQDIDDVAKLINMNVLAGAHHQIPHHAHQLPYHQHQHAPPAVSSHPLCLKAEPSTADHGLASSSSSSSSAYMPAPAPTPLASSSGSSSLFAGPSRASELAAGMNKANNYQSLVTELSDLRRYNTRLEHTLQNILVEVQQLRSRSEGSATNGVVRVKTEQPQPQTQPVGPPLLDQQQPHQQILHAAPPTHLQQQQQQQQQQHIQHVMQQQQPIQQQQMVGEAVHFQAAYGGGNEVPGIATWRVHDSTLLECNDRFMEIVQQPLDTLKNNFKCLQLFPQRLYDEFIGYKQAVLYGDGSGNPSKDSFFLLPDGREKPVVMTLQALKHEDNMSPQFMVMHVVEVLPIAVPQATTPPGGEAADFLQRESGHGDSMAPPLRSATVTSITEVDPSTLHAAPAAASAVPTSSTSSLSTSLPPSAILPPATPGEVQPQLQGQQHQLAPSL